MKWLVAIVCAPAFTAPTVAAAQSVARYTLAGTITDAAGAAITEAEVVLVMGLDSVRLRSDDSGHFRAAGLPTSAVSIHVRRLGYQPKVVNVAIKSEPIIIVLDPNPAELGTVKVQEMAAEQDQRLREFHARKATNSFGRYFEQSDIERRHPQYLSELLRTIPGVTLAPSSRGGFAVHLRGCSPLVWVDGVRVPNTQLDELAEPIDVAALEVYSSFAGIPAQYFDRSANCGTILVWTRAK
jgi:hypothetical protein